MQTSSHVKQNRQGSDLAGMTTHATVNATVESFADINGEAHGFDPGGEYTQHCWYFETPRGRAVVRDFHTLPRGLLAIISVDRAAARWLVRYLRQLKFKSKMIGGNDAD